MKNIMLGAVLGFVMMVPASTFAATPMTDAEIRARIAVIEQIISLIRQQIALMNMSDGQTASTTPESTVPTGELPVAPVLGGAEDFTISVTVDQGQGSWQEFDKKCRGSKKDPSFDCANDFLDGKVRFTIEGDFKSAVLTYYPTQNPKDVVTTGGIFQGNSGVAGIFKPNTEYTWRIVAKDNQKREAVAIGTFETGDYEI